MATFCIGDMHGRNDLFFRLLDKIKFNPEEDKLFILGDVIDGGQGGIEILKYVKCNESCTLIRGNHESNLISMKKELDIFMLNYDYKKGIKPILEVYSDKLYEKIEKEYTKLIFKKKDKRVLENKKILKWIKSGNPSVRNKLISCMTDFVESINYDEELYKTASKIFKSLRGRFNTKESVIELFNQTEEEYKELFELLNNTPHKISLDINDRKFVLVHGIRQIDTSRFYSHNLMCPHAKTKDITYVFGHDPVPRYHEYIAKPYNNCGFSFEYHRIFAYCDHNNNFYYNLDLGSNPIAAICLDNMNEYYVGIPSERKNAKQWLPLTDTKGIQNDELRVIDKAYFYDKVNDKMVNIETDNDNCAYMSLRKGCYEFLIGVDSENRRILYTRVDLLDYHPAFIIDNWYLEQTESEILDKVKDDFNNQCKTKELKGIYRILFGDI